MAARKPPPTLDKHTTAHVSELFRAFSDTSRVRSLSAIVERELNVSALAQLVGVTKSAISHHLRALRQLHLVQARREGREVYYSIVDPHILELFIQGVEHARSG